MEGVWEATFGMPARDSRCLDFPEFAPFGFGVHCTAYSACRVGLKFNRQPIQRLFLAKNRHHHYRMHPTYLPRVGKEDSKKQTRCSSLHMCAKRRESNLESHPTVAAGTSLEQKPAARPSGSVPGGL